MPVTRLTPLRLGADADAENSPPIDPDALAYFRCERVVADVVLTGSFTSGGPFDRALQPWGAP